VFASSLGFLSGATHSYFWNARHTFAAAGHGGGLRVVARFGVVVLSGLVVSAATFLAVTLLLGPHARGLAIAKAASIGVVTGWDFLLARSWAFRPQRGASMFEVPPERALAHSGVEAGADHP
jgi:putative flippase GtrA